MVSIRKYNVSDSIVFQKTKSEFGGLSNMASGFILNVNNTIISSAEHLYQACRFPAFPEIQHAIISEPNPIKAKWIGRKYISKTREDWESVRFKIMRWVLEIKLSQNWETFGGLLKATGEKQIVERAPKDKIWGAVLENDILIGTNALGRLLMEIRETHVTPNYHQRCVQPLPISNFLLLGHQIDYVCDDSYLDEIKWSLSGEYTTC